MKELELEEPVVTLEDIATTTTRVLNRTVKSALQNAQVEHGEGVERDTRNALLLVSLLKQLAELRALRG